MLGEYTLFRRLDGGLSSHRRHHGNRGFGQNWKNKV